MYLIHIQLGFLGLKDIRRKESINWIGSVMCLCCCCYWRTANVTSALAGVLQPKRLCLAAYPSSAAQKSRSGLNRIGHPDWVKLCVELNCGLNQNSFCYTRHGISGLYGTEHRYRRGCPRGVMVKAMDCGIVVSEFVLQSRYYVHFRTNTLGKCMNRLILLAMG